jgi:hypothetical protein
MIRNLIEEQADWRVIAEASDGLEAVEKAKMDCPDLAILEMSMSKMNGIDAARQIVTSCPRTIILADSFHDFRRFGDELSKSGIHGFVLKSPPIWCRLLKLFSTGEPGLMRGGDTPEKAMARSLLEIIESRWSIFRAAQPCDASWLLRSFLHSLLFISHSLKRLRSCRSGKAAEVGLNV